MSELFSANGSHDAPIFLSEQHMRYAFIWFVRAASYFSFFGLAIFDGWVNSCPDPPLATLVVINDTVTRALKYGKKSTTVFGVH